MNSLLPDLKKDVEHLEKTRPIAASSSKGTGTSSKSIKGRMRTLMLFLYRALRVGALLKYAPAWVQEWKNKEWHAEQIRMRPKLVIEEALRPKYREGLTRLMNTYGATSLGDYLEFGVYHGTSLTTMDRVLKELGLGHVRLFGFDSFEGLPVTPDVDNHWLPGAFKSDYALTLKVLKVEKVNMERVVLTKGFYDATLDPAFIQRHKLRKASVIMVDCDMYSSAKEALTFCEPLIVDETMIVFDDWYVLAEQGGGEKRALEEFLTEHRCFEVEDFGDYPPYGKVFFVKRERARRMITNDSEVGANHGYGTKLSVEFSDRV